MTLTPSFSPVAFAYEGVTSARSCTFRLTTTSANATIRYRVNDGWTYTIGSGTYSAFSWSEGENEMTVTVTNGDTTCVYSFSVTYEPEQA